MVSFISAIAFFGRYFKFYELIYIPVVFFAMSQFPAFYVYIKTITSEGGWNRRSLIHFILPGITAIVAGYIHYYLLTGEENSRFFSEIITGTPAITPKLKFAFYVDRLSKNSFIVLGIFYYWLTNRKVRSHRKHINDYFSTTAGVNIGWIRIYNITFFFTLAAGVLFHSMDRESFMDEDWLLAVVFAPLTIFFWVIGYYGNKQKNIYPEHKEVLVIQSISPDVQNLKQKLLTTLGKQKIYLDPDINLPSLSRELGTNRTYLSQLINQEFGLNFNQFINKYRTEEAKVMLTQEALQYLTVKEIGEKCGFSTHQSFVRCFREYYDVTPGAYKKSIFQ